MGMIANYYKPGQAMSRATAGYKMGKGGNIALGLPLMAMEVAMAPRGEVIPIAAKSLVAMVLYPVATAAISAVGVPPWAAALLAGFVVDPVVKPIESGVRLFSQIDRRVSRLQMGGSLQDSESAYALRQRAVTDISGSLLPARRLLGQEALFLHQ